jgi:hypothetical protein
MRLSPFAAIVAACVLTLSACGDDGDEPSAENDPSASESGTTEPSGKGSKDAKGGKNTETGDARPDGSAPICDAVDAEEVGEIVGGSLKKGGVGDSCLLTDASNPAGGSVSLSEASLASLGGEDGLKTALGLVQGEPDEVADVGDLAYVVVGKGLIGGVSAAGAVAVEDKVVQVQFNPSTDVKKDEAREKTVALLELVAETL